ncbi:FAD-dependent monooxygenase [Gordonia iterans]
MGRGSIRVLVVGAGVGGLASAGALRRAGAEVTVVERTDRFGRVGAGLSLFGNGFRALEALGLDTAVRAVVAPTAPEGQSGIRRPDGRWLVRGAPTATRDLRIADRTELHGALLAAAIGVDVRTGVDVATAHDDGVVTAGGDRMGGYDLVVGADGLRSRVRRGWPHDASVAYAGYGAWRGIAPYGRPLRAHGETVGRGKRFGMVPLRDGRVYWFAVVNADRTERPAVEALESGFASWHRPIPELIASTAASQISYLPIEYLSEPPPSYVLRRRVLLGDAAHAMPPDLGQGANQALEDAAVLVRELTPAIRTQDPAAIPQALLRYDRRRRPRSRRIAWQAALIGRVMQSSGPLGVVRDAALRTIPDRAVTRQAARLQDWAP